MKLNIRHFPSQRTECVTLFSHSYRSTARDVSSCFASADGVVLSQSKATVRLKEYRSYLPHSPWDDSAPPSLLFPWSSVAPFPHCPGVPGPVSGGQPLPWWKWESARFCRSCRNTRTGGYCGAHSRALLNSNYGSEVFASVCVFGSNSYESSR